MDSAPRMGLSVPSSASSPMQSVVSSMGARICSEAASTASARGRS